MTPYSMPRSVVTESYRRQLVASHHDDEKLSLRIAALFMQCQRGAFYGRECRTCTGIDSLKFTLAYTSSLVTITYLYGNQYTATRKVRQVFLSKAEQSYDFMISSHYTSATNVV